MCSKITAAHTMRYEIYSLLSFARFGAYVCKMNQKTPHDEYFGILVTNKLDTYESQAFQLPYKSNQILINTLQTPQAFTIQCTEAKKHV